MTDAPAILHTILAELRQLRAEMAELRAPAPAAPADSAAVLRAEAERMGVRIVMGNYITEADAAQLLDRSRGNLKHRRLNGKPIARPLKLLGRWHYLLTDLAEVQPEDLDENEL